MDCGPILDIATRLWDCTAKRLVYIRELQENLNSLKILTEELSNLRKDVMVRVEHEEQLKQSRRTHEVGGWLRAVQLMQVQVEDILQKGDQEVQKKCHGTCCPKNCWSSYRLGKIVTKKIEAVTELKGKGHFTVVAHRLPCPPVDERSMGKTVGLDLMFDKVRKCLEDEQVRSIGLYGLGGVGKTTLLKKINNEYFVGRNDFDVVIWIVVSKPVSIEKIQDVILKKLGTPDEKWERSNKEEKAAEIFKLLKAKKFVILLDDMWERLDLLDMGIPHLNDQTKSKVVLTTRSERVCNDMEVDKSLKVECLTPNEAFSLFCDKVGDLVNSHPDIRRLAKIVVEECRGLPLAIVVIGRSMASRKMPRDWEQAIQVLKSYPAEFSGMGDQVFPILKFSFDNLDNDTIKSCFLYCSLFPEDHNIWNENLIDLWIGEGFLDKFGDLNEARNQGEEIIRSLKLACLLEGDVSKNKCKMHDVIRDMALWLSCDYGKEKHKILVLEDVKPIQAHETVKWKGAQRIALWGSYINAGFSVSPCFLNLQTLILRDSKMRSLPTGFFQDMPVIRVLDLEGNRRLHELPLETCRLETLEYLNLRWTSIEKIPIELKNLTKLRCLKLDHIDRLEVIAPNVICCLLNLQMFSMILDNIGIKEYEEGFMVSMLQELDCLQYLSEMSISLPTLPAVQKFLTSQKLQKCIKNLYLSRCQGLKEMELPLSTLQRMRSLAFQNCEHLERVKIKMGNGEKHGFSRGGLISNSIFHNLFYVSITGCLFLDLTWLIYAPSLEYLMVGNSDKMEEIIGSTDEGGDSEIEQQSLTIFSRLNELRLNDLPNLKSICRRALPFPSLKEISVFGCPNLRKLPLNSNNATNTLEKIEGESSWWGELEWEDDNLKSTFTPYFRKRD